ncbi:hypothetical protein ACMD2_09597, partial [Ananas comosus]
MRFRNFPSLAKRSSSHHLHLPLPSPPDPNPNPNPNPKSSHHPLLSYPGLFE